MQLNSVYSWPSRNTGKLTLVDGPHECAQCKDREESVAVTCKRRHKAKAASSWGCTGVHCSAPGFHTIFLFLLDAPRLSNTRPATTFTTLMHVVRARPMSWPWVWMLSGAGEHAMNFQTLWLSRGFELPTLYNGQYS